jgi:hypothetical protein
MCRLKKRKVKKLPINSAVSRNDIQLEKMIFDTWFEIPSAFEIVEFFLKTKNYFVE